MGNQAEFLFTVPIGINLWGLVEHEPLTVAFFLPVVSRSNWSSTWKIKEGEWEDGTVRALDREYKR